MTALNTLDSPQGGLKVIGLCDRCWTGVMVIGKCTGDRGGVTGAGQV